MEKIKNGNSIYCAHIYNECALHTLIHRIRIEYIWDHVDLIFCLVY